VLDFCTRVNFRPAYVLWFYSQNSSSPSVSFSFFFSFSGFHTFGPRLLDPSFRVRVIPVFLFSSSTPAEHIALFYLSKYNTLPPLYIYFLLSPVLATANLSGSFTLPLVYKFCFFRFANIPPVSQCISLDLGNLYVPSVDFYRFGIFHFAPQCRLLRLVPFTNLSNVIEGFLLCAFEIIPFSCPPQIFAYSPYLASESTDSP